MTITPTVGRRVWFWPGDTAGRYNCIDPAQPFDAGVIYVHNDRCVNLIVTDHQGYTFRVEEATLVQDEERPTGPHATWMPWQLGQAKQSGSGGS